VSQNSSYVLGCCVWRTEVCIEGLLDLAVSEPVFVAGVKMPLKSIPDDGLLSEKELTSNRSSSLASLIAVRLSSFGLPFALRSCPSGSGTGEPPVDWGEEPGEMEFGSGMSTGFSAVELEDIASLDCEGVGNSFLVLVATTRSSA